MQDAVLAAFFIVDHKLNRDAGPVRPIRVRWGLAVAMHIAGVAVHTVTPVFPMYITNNSESFQIFLESLVAKITHSILQRFTAG